MFLYWQMTFLLHTYYIFTTYLTYLFTNILVKKKNCNIIFIAVELYNQNLKYKLSVHL